jgi:hypothetical protein
MLPPTPHHQKWPSPSASPCALVPPKKTGKPLTTQISNLLPYRERFLQTHYKFRLRQQVRFHQGVLSQLLSMPKSPPPDSYQLPTSFDPPTKSVKGFCFGEGRDEMTITGPLAETINNKNPGPGAY